MKKSTTCKRALAFALAAAMTFSVAGCSPKDSGASTASQAAASGAAKTDSAWAGIDLSKRETVNCYVVGMQGTDWKTVTDKAVADMEKKINTTVKFVYVPWSDFQSKYTTFLAADQDVDMIYASAWNGFSQYVHSGAFKAIDMNFVKKNMPLTYQKQDKDSWKEATINGKLYGIPHNNTYLGAGGVITTQDILDKVNMKASDINSLDSFNKFLLAVAKDHSNGLYGVNCQNAFPLDSQYLGYHSYNVDAGNVTWMLYPYNSGNLKGSFDINNLQWFATTDAYKQFCLKMAELNKAGVFPANILSNSTMIDDSFNAGKSAVNFQDPYQAYSTRENLKAKNKKVVYLDCLFDKDSTIMKGAYMGYAICFPTSSTKSERAATALDCMKFDPEVNRLLLGGIEGEHYVIDKTTNRRTLGPKAAAYPWGSWFYMFDNPTDPKQKIDDDLQKVQDNYLSKEVSTKNFPLGGFSYDTSKYQSQMAVLSSLFNQYRFSFCFGVYQDNTQAKLDEFIKKCKAAGIDDVLKDYKAQVQKFATAK